MQSTLRRAVWLVTVGMVLLGSTGCAGLVNPHVTWTPPTGPGRPPVTLDQAVEYADAAKDAYREAIGNQSRLINWLGIGIIPLMAASAGIGITGGPATAMTATALTGAAGYGVGTWLYSKPNQRAWVAGYNATSCAVSAVAPLRTVSRRKTEIEAHLAALNLKLPAVVAGANALSGELTRATKLDARIRADGTKMVRDADTLIAAGAATRTNALKMLEQADGAGELLREAVDRIRGQVSGLLVESAQDLQTLGAIVGGLVQNYQGFSAVVAAAKPAATDVTAQGRREGPRAAEARTAEDTRVSTLMADLDAAMRDLSAATRTVADDLDRLAGATPVETLRSCGVSADQVTAPLSVDPPGPISFEAGTSATEGRVVKGGAPPYAIELHGKLTDLTLQKTEPHGPAFSIQTTDKTPAGKATVFVSERSGNKMFIPIIVGAKAPEVSAPPASPAPAEAAALKQAAQALQGQPTVDVGAFTVTVDAAELKAAENKIAVGVSIKKGAALATASEAAGVTDDAITQALLGLDAVKGLGLSKSHFVIATRKPPKP